MEENQDKHGLIELTAEIVSAYVSNNTVVAKSLGSIPPFKMKMLLHTRAVMKKKKQ